MLSKLGLNSYESRAYRSLLQLGASTAHAVARESQVPSGKIYPVLDSLTAKGFVLSRSGRPRIFTAVSPEIALGRVIALKKRDLKELRVFSQEFAAAYSKIQHLAGPKEADLVETYFGRLAAFSRSVILHGQAQKYWKTISRLTVSKEHLDACRRAVRKGVKVLALTTLQETSLHRVEEWRKRGVQVRFLEELPFRMSIYDDKGVVFRFSHGKSKRYVGVHIRNNSLARGLSAFFDSLWEEAEEKF